MVVWERRMWNVLTEKEVLNALEHLRIEIHVHNNTRWCVNKKIKVTPTTGRKGPRGFRVG
jgi:hypothetical protein